jgi:thiol-disulfide isomerase/thioredoxin
MSRNEIRFTIQFPTDNGFFGRECNNPECGKYFKVHENSLVDEMYCPYCAESFSKENLLTQDQTKYVEEFTNEKAEQFIHDELQKMFKRTTRNSKFLKFESSRRSKKHISPKYKEKKTDSEFTCPYCDCNFQVYGVFGYCPGCKKENILIYDANKDFILKEIENASNKERALRHAYSDIVSTFEIFCRNKAKIITTDTTNFQDIYKTRRFFKKHLAIDILEDLTHEEELAFKRIFHKRHVYDHNNGVISEKYVTKIPEDKDKLNDKAELSIVEFQTGANVIRLVLNKIINKIH